MKNWKLITAALLFSGQVLAVEFPIEVIEYMDDTKVVAFVSQTDIDAASTWNPMKSDAPLCVTEALAAVKKALASYPVDIGAIELASIELKEFPHQPGHWHYLVRLKKQDPEAAHPAFYVVLMNGKAIPATREPQAYK